MSGPDPANAGAAAADVVLCPCGSGIDYAGCCGPIQHGTPAPTALALMRSRFTAFTLQLAGHLLRTWHPDTRPRRIDFDEGILWRRLQIVDTVRGGEGDTDGIVEFRAIYSGPQGTGFVHERSRFVREDDRWLYVDGIVFDD